MKNLFRVNLNKKDNKMDRVTLLKKILSVNRLKTTFKKVDAFG